MGVTRRSKAVLIRSVVLGSAIFGQGLPAAADPPAPPAGGDVLAQYTFDDQQVVGGGTAPLGEVLVVRPRDERGSLVRARDAFVRELIRSVEAL